MHYVEKTEKWKEVHFSGLFSSKKLFKDYYYYLIYLAHQPLDEENDKLETTYF